VDYSQADVDFFLTTSKGKYGQWYWWNECGRVNGIRGNYIPASQTWERPEFQVFHQNLDAYATLVPIVDSFSGYVSCDGVSFPPLPRSFANHLENQFYSDLEQCHIAHISTHGGAAGGIDIYQILRKRDVWATLHKVGDKGLGYGNLRHLFLETCSSMNWLYGPGKGEYKNIFSDWMNNHIADGIRTVCGHDSEMWGWDRLGWRFFGGYHLGDSISSSWMNGLMTECLLNHPVVLSYGNSEMNALEILLDGRFSKERAGNSWVAACTAWVVGN
jgi:hypothetical protein